MTDKKTRDEKAQARVLAILASGPKDAADLTRPNRSALRPLEKAGKIAYDPASGLWSLVKVTP